MARVEAVQRLTTKGGLAPAAACDASTVADEVSVRYEAEYYFYGPPRPGILHYKSAD